MIVTIRQNISNLLDEDRKIIDSSCTELFVLSPEAGKRLKNTITGKVEPSFVYLKTIAEKSHYIEI